MMPVEKQARRKSIDLVSSLTFFPFPIYSLPAYHPFNQHYVLVRKSVQGAHLWRVALQVGRMYRRWRSTSTLAKIGLRSRSTVYWY